MRIERITLTDYPPIKNIDIQITSNLVIIAGANGSGKTRLKEAIIYPFATEHESNIYLFLRATRPEEETIWQSKSLEILAGRRNPALRTYLATRIRENSFSGILVPIESNRTVNSIRLEPLGLTTADPDEQGLDFTWHLYPVTERWNNLVNYLYKKSAIRNSRIAKFVLENPEKAKDAITSYPDVFAPYRELFSKLLPGKVLNQIEPTTPREFQYSLENSKPLDFQLLSSGEKEVVTMVFELAYKEISHSVIIIDEPELHLHPSLTFRFIETLKGLGDGTNQIILFTHSADLISSYYSTGNVFLIDSNSNEENQAYLLSKLNEKHSEIARVASANLGMFAVGKKLILVEGKTDHLIYSKITQSFFSDFHIIPVNSVENILALKAVISELDNSIFGIKLFLIRDRDGLSDTIISSLEKNPRFRCIPRQHIENYFFDTEILSIIANMLNIGPKKSETQKIQEILLEHAQKNVMAGALWNVREYIRIQSVLSLPRINQNEVLQMSHENLVENFVKQITSSIDDRQKKFEKATIEALIFEEHKKLGASLTNDKWQELLPGKDIFNRFCSEYFHEKPERIQEIYTNLAIQKKPQVFQDIFQIFQSFSDVRS